MIIIKHKGSFAKTDAFLKKASRFEVFQILEKYGKLGVEMLSSYTPIRSGETAHSWDYQIHKIFGGYSLTWTNSNVNDGVNIALILQLGHGTGTGGYVAGVDYINPALVPIFDKIGDAAWQEIVSA